MRCIRIPLALLLAGTMVGCGIVLGIDDYQPDCEASNCIQCTDPATCGAPDPCAPWTCETGYCKKAPLPSRTPCSPGVCDGEGRCVDCVVTKDCPVWESCGSWTCEHSQCVLHLEPSGTIPPQVPGDCQSTQCGEDGHIVSSTDATDVPPSTDCQIGTCLNGKPYMQPVPHGTLCDENGGKLCDGKGACVECTTNKHCGNGFPHICELETNKCFSCLDGIQNGNESDIDCGGYCAACGNGKTCKPELAAWDCQSGFCVDGVCCASACNEACSACNIAPDVGYCSIMPKYSEDTSPDGSQSCLNQDGKACNAGGVCGVALGAPCSTNVDCSSYKCRDNNGDGKMECVKDAGDPCTLAAECYSFICSNGLCAP